MTWSVTSSPRLSKPSCAPGGSPAILSSRSTAGPMTSCSRAKTAAAGERATTIRKQPALAEKIILPEDRDRLGYVTQIRVRLSKR
jgi:hypothetical protein